MRNAVNIKFDIFRTLIRAINLITHLFDLIFVLDFKNPRKFSLKMSQLKKYTCCHCSGEVWGRWTVVCCNTGFRSLCILNPRIKKCDLTFAILESRDTEKKLRMNFIWDIINFYEIPFCLIQCEAIRSEQFENEYFS